MSNDLLRIGKLATGYEVELRDPKIVAENEKPRSSWQDPWKSYPFKTEQETAAFVGAVLPLLNPTNGDDEFAAAFKAATDADDTRK